MNKELEKELRAVLDLEPFTNRESKPITVNKELDKELNQVLVEDTYDTLTNKLKSNEEKIKELDRLKQELLLENARLEVKLDKVFTKRK